MNRSSGSWVGVYFLSPDRLFREVYGLMQFQRDLSFAADTRGTSRAKEFGSASKLDRATQALPRPKPKYLVLNFDMVGGVFKLSSADNMLNLYMPEDACWHHAGYEK